MSNDDIIGFRVALEADGSSDTKDIVDGEIVEGIIMLDGTEELTVPNSGGVRTYKANGVFNKIQLFPILEGGAKCDLADEITLTECS